MYGVGGILSGENRKDMLLGDIMGSETISEAFKQMREDDAVKAVVFDVADGGAGEIKWLGRQIAKIRQRDPLKLAREGFEAAAEEAGVGEDEIAYIATTGEAESLTFATGHFYSMTTHARGGIYLEPSARAILDVGALHGWRRELFGVNQAPCLRQKKRQRSKAAP